MTDEMTFAQAVALIDASWKNWIAAIEAVPESRWNEPGVCGDWSIRDLSGHIAVWDQYFVGYLGRCARGEATGAVDWQAVNDEAMARQAGRGIAEQRAEMEEAHVAVIGALATPVSFKPGQLSALSWRHYDEHAAEVRAWS